MTAMLRRPAIALTLLVSVTLLTLSVSAHAPEFPGGNESLGQATEIHDPTKSWAIYAQLHEGGTAQYYLLSMKKGEDINVSLIAPRSAIDGGFLPSMALMGPGIDGNDTAPRYVKVPDGAGVEIMQGTLPPLPSYEPFSPSAFYELGSIAVTAPQDGDYYLAVFENDTGGNYGLAVGLRESFTAGEWLVVPFSDLSIYQWEGQGLWMALAPAIITFIVGLLLMLVASRNRLRAIDALWVLATFSGLLMVASGISLLFQMLWALSLTGAEPAVVVTLIFSVLPLALGSAALRVAQRERPMKGIRPRTRLGLLIIGTLALLLWAGWIMGPVLIIVTALLPSRSLLRRVSKVGPAR
jgi:hypothetical protein